VNIAAALVISKKPTGKSMENLLIGSQKQQQRMKFEAI